MPAKDDHRIISRLQLTECEIHFPWLRTNQRFDFIGFPRAALDRCEKAMIPGNVLIYAFTIVFSIAFSRIGND